MTDTTGPARGETDHLAEIRDLTDRVGDRASDLASSAYWPEQTIDEMIIDPLNEVDHHAEALAAQRDEAEARAGSAERKVAWYEWMARERARIPGVSDDELTRLAALYMDAPGDTEGES